MKGTQDKNTTEHLIRDFRYFPLLPGCIWTLISEQWSLDSACQKFWEFEEIAEHFANVLSRKSGIGQQEISIWKNEPCIPVIYRIRIKIRIS